ncbi:MAG: hypothetical protein RL412_319 [Pseudomonadota bacterium]
MRLWRLLPVIAFYSVISFAEEQRAFFTIDEVLRAEPVPTALVVGRAQAGERVSARERKGFWRRVELRSGVTGWVRISSVRLFAPGPAAGLAAIASGRDATNNVVLVSGTRSMLGRNAPLDRATILAATADPTVIRSVSSVSYDSVARASFAAAGGLVPRKIKLPGLSPAGLAAAATVDPKLAQEEIAAMLFGVAKPLNENAVQTYVNHVGQWVVSRIGGGAQWRFIVVDSPSIISFALPGGLVIVSSGLYRLLTTEDEFAAVLAREIAHARRGHHLKNLRQPSIETYLRPLDPALDFIADEEGMRLAASAGYDASALIGVLERIAAASSQGFDVALLKATSPTINDRIATLAGAVTPELESAVVPSAASARINQYKVKDQ